MDRSSTTKKDMEEAPRGLGLLSSEGEKGGSGGDGDDGVQAPAQKKMTRLPQEEIDWILSLTKPLSTYTPEADLAESDSDDDVNELLRDIARARDSLWEKIYKFQDWVRSEYAANGFVEVDDDFLARRAECQAIIRETFDGLSDSELDAGDY